MHLSLANLGRLTSASQTGNALSFTYDALSRNLTQAGPQGTVSSQWDIAGRRTRLTYPGSGLFVDYDFLVTGDMTRIRENGATSGIGVLATYAYDDLGRRTALTFGNGASQAYGYDPVSRLTSLTNELTGTTNDLSATFSYNPASQAASTVRTGDAYAWTGHFNQNVTGTANGLNQLTSVGPKNLTHDGRGNVIAFGTKSFTYNSENLLLTGPGGTTLGYDPAMRLQQIVSGGATTKLAYDGLDRIAEYDAGSTLLRRYVHGPGEDEPLVWYEGSGTSDRRFLSSDDLGSIISLTDNSGAVLGLNKYDEYGNPQAGNLGVFGYTGQAWLPTMGEWHYKARVFDPELGRFLQTDPIGIEGGMNFYAYVGNDPINATDPLGLNSDVSLSQPIIVRGYPLLPDFGMMGGNAITNLFGNFANWLSGDNEKPTATVTGPKRCQGARQTGCKVRPVRVACSTPPISSSEARAANQGSRTEFWSSRYRRGDPYGAIGLTVSTNSSLAGQMANVRLVDAISARSPNMNPAAVLAEANQVGVDLMRAYVNAVGQFGNVSAAQFADVHHTVFGAHGLPPNTFGGTPFFGARLETAITAGVWRICP